MGKIMQFPDQSLSAIEAPSYILDDIVAAQTFYSIVDAYKSRVGKLAYKVDVHAISEYAKTYSEYVALVDRQIAFPEVTHEEIAGSRGNITIKKTAELLEWEALDLAIDRKRKLMIHMEDRLILNPKSRGKHKKSEAKTKRKDLRTIGFSGV